MTVVASDFAASLAFYDAALSALGLQRAAEFGDEEEDDPAVEVAGWSATGGAPVLWLVSGTLPTSGAHVTLRVAARADVEAFFAAGCGSGGSARSAPRRWAIYRQGTISAAVADPDGNIIEAVAPE